MDDYLSKDYIEQENKYRGDALKESFRYLKTRKSGEELNKAQSVIYPLLRSYEYKIRHAKRNAELSLRGIKFDLIRKASLEKKINDLNNRLSNLENALQIDFAHNPYISGKLSYGLCEEFSLEDAESFTLFNEVRNYLERHSKENDVDRLQLLSKISQLKNLMSNARHEAVKKEADFISEALEVIDREMKSYNDLTNNDIFVIYDDFKHGVKKNRSNPDYISQLYSSHSPQYKDKEKNSFDGFGEKAKKSSSDLFKHKILSMGNESNKIVGNPKYNLDKINDLLQRKQEVNEILTLVERIMNVIDEKNHTTISGESRAEINYDSAIIVAQDLEKFCEALIDKYEKELKNSKYYELEEMIKEGKVKEEEESNSIDYNIERKFKNIPPKDDLEIKVEETKEQSSMLKEKNNQMISELDITPELLKLAADDLCLFGFLNDNNLDELTPMEMNSVINHCIKLREISNLSDEEKTAVRATWPRIENGKRVEKINPEPSDIIVQRNLDNMRSIINRINSYAQYTSIRL